jgi:hypothetical protein
MPQTSVFKDRWFWFSLIIGGIILCSTLWYGLGMDQAIYCYSAWLWRDYGLPPYVNQWSGDFPGIFILHRLVLALFGDSSLGFRIFDCLVQGSCLAMIFWLARLFSGNGVSGFLASIFYAVYYCGLRMLTAERDGYGLWLILVSVVLSIFLEQRFRLRAFVVGLFLGFVFLLKPTLGFSWLVFGIWFLVEGRNRSRRSLFLEMVVFVLGCFAPSAAVVLWYWQAGNLRELYYGPLFFSWIYSQQAGFGFWGMFKIWLFLLWTLMQEMPVVLAGALLGMMVPLVKWRESEGRRIYLIFLGLLTACAGSFFLQVKNIPYHRTPLWGILMVFSGFGWSWAGKQLKGLRRGLPGEFAAGIFYLMILLIVFCGQDTGRVKFCLEHYGRGFDKAYLDAPDSVGDAYRAANYLQPLLKPEDGLVMFGQAPLLPYLLKKKQPSKFTMPVLLLLHPRDRGIYPVQEQWKEQYQDEVISARPKYFLIYVREPKKILNIYELPVKEILAEEFSRLNQFLDDNYELVRVVDNVEIHVLKFRR